MGGNVTSLVSCTLTSNVVLPPEPVGPRREARYDPGLSPPISHLHGLISVSNATGGRPLAGSAVRSQSTTSPRADTLPDWRPA